MYIWQIKILFSCLVRAILFLVNIEYEVVPSSTLSLTSINRRSRWSALIKSHSSTNSLLCVPLPLHLEGPANPERPGQLNFLSWKPFLCPDFPGKLEFLPWKHEPYKEICIYPASSFDFCRKRDINVCFQFFPFRNDAS